MKTAQFDLHADIESRHWWFTARRRIMRRCVEQLAPAGAGVTDVGCGTGANIAILSDAYACHGIDPEAHAIELARQRFPQVDFTCGLAPACFTDGHRQSRVFLLMDVLEHVPDDFQFFSRLWAALPAGAHLLLTVPAEEALWSPHDEAFGHYRRYDIPRLRRVWRDLPVTERLVSAYVARLYPLVKMVRGVTSRRGHTGGRAGTDFRMPPAPVNAALRGLMAGEAGPLLAGLDRPGRPPYAHGVSLLAILRREAGPVEERTRPGDVPADLHQPRAAGTGAPA